MDYSLIDSPSKREIVETMKRLNQAILEPEFYDTEALLYLLLRGYANLGDVKNFYDLSLSMPRLSNRIIELKDRLDERVSVNDTKNNYTNLRLATLSTIVALVTFCGYQSV